MSSKISSTEFIINDEDESSIIIPATSGLPHSSIQVSLFKQTALTTQRNEKINESEVNSAGTVAFSAKKLFDEREHESLMDIPQREIQSVNSPSNNDITQKTEENSLNLQRLSVMITGSSGGVELRVIEDKLKR